MLYTLISTPEPNLGAQVLFHFLDLKNVTNIKARKKNFQLAIVISSDTNSKKGIKLWFAFTQKL